MKLTILVIIFNRKIIDNQTISSLMEQDGQFNDVNVVIFNNGPDYFENINDVTLGRLKELFHRVTIIQNPKNNPLSYIYNDFIDNYHSDYFCILDDDTDLTSSYINSLINETERNKEVDVILPIILSAHNDKIYYPLVSGFPFDKKINSSDNILSDNTVFSIGSGLTFSKRLCDKMRKYNINPFDERFALYGVDFSFFRNILTLKQNGENINLVVIEELYHDMSGVEINIKRWRYIEREYDRVLSIRHYSSNYFFSLLKINLLVLKHFSSFDMEIAFMCLKTYFLGRHPRCLKKESNLFEWKSPTN